MVLFSNTCRPHPYLYKNDHIYPGANKTDVPVVILYAEIGTKKFTSFHTVLSEKAEAGALTYILRHFVAVSSPDMEYMRALHLFMLFAACDLWIKTNTMIQ